MHLRNLCLQTATGGSIKRHSRLMADIKMPPDWRKDKSVCLAYSGQHTKHRRLQSVRSLLPLRPGQHTKRRKMKCSNVNKESPSPQLSSWPAGQLHACSICNSVVELVPQSEQVLQGGDGDGRVGQYASRSRETSCRWHYHQGHSRLSRRAAKGDGRGTPAYGFSGGGSDPDSDGGYRADRVASARARRRGREPRGHRRRRRLLLGRRGELLFSHVRIALLAPFACYRQGAPPLYTVGESARVTLHLTCGLGLKSELRVDFFSSAIKNVDAHLWEL